VGKRTGSQPLILRAAIERLDGKAPAAIRLLRFGVNESDYGPITFDEIAAAMVEEAYRTEGKERLYADWNHGMLPASEDDKPTREQGAASASFIPEVRNGELWAADIQWTDDGRADVESGAYNLFSPAFNWECGSDGVLRPRKLINFALVNQAGLHDIAPLMAAMAADLARKESDMTPEQIAAMQTRLTELETENKGLRIAHTEISTLSGVLALSATAGPDQRSEVVRGLVGLQRNVLALTGQDTVAGATGVLAGWKEKALGYDQLATEKAAGEVLALTAELDGVITAASKDGKAGFAPAQLDQRRADALKIGGGKVTKDGVLWLRGFADSMPKAVVTPGDAPRQPAGGPGPAGPGAAKMDRLMNVDSAKFETWRAGEIQAGRLPA